ncbi:MAG TPA: alpha/beta fold hydrolase [Hyphomicrobiaceae bacterium]|nr:alpha/beta fold hydrolase [Hyphomicrobiaceae bacterium]
MTAMTLCAPAQTRRRRVIALHCSGAGPAQWRELAGALAGRHQLLAPAHYGCDGTDPWSGAHAFRLADEALRTLELIDAGDGQAHLVGHSYGGAVALMVALSRPGRIASMVLYEPSAFFLLRSLGASGRRAHAEIAGIVRRVCAGVITGDYAAAAGTFVDYWNGPGSWQAMRPALRQSLVRWLPKAPLDFHALLAETTSPTSLAELSLPVLVLRGEHAPMPSRLLAQHLSELLPAARLTVVAGAGHMGPVTHAAQVSALMAQHIATAEAEALTTTQCCGITHPDVGRARPVPRHGEAAR